MHRLIAVVAQIIPTGAWAGGVSVLACIAEACIHTCSTELTGPRLEASKARVFRLGVRGGEWRPTVVGTCAYRLQPQLLAQAWGPAIIPGVGSTGVVHRVRLKMNPVHEC